MLFDTALEHVGAHPVLVAAWLDHAAAAPAPASVARRGCRRKTAAAGEAAIIGIRPSDIRLAAKGEKAIASKIHLLEPLGDITIVSVETGKEVLRMVLPEAKATSIRVGDPASIYIDPNDIHIFRAASGQVMT